MPSSPASPGPFGSANPPNSASPAQRKLIALFNIIIYMVTVWVIELVLRTYTGHDQYLYWFSVLFAWRYIRFFVSCLSWCAYRPAPVSAKPRYLPHRDVTVILPTIDPTGVDFQECILTCAQNLPAAILVITAGDELLRKTQAAVQPFMDRFPTVKFTIQRTMVASKREQVALAIPLVKTPITVMLDDHVFWRPDFLAGLLAPFEDLSVGLVGTNKAVRRVDNLSPWRRIWNMIGSVYLLRHNFEIRATNTVDGGVFVVSARTCAIRTAIIQDPAYLAGYTNELFFFRRFGPLNADDDNYNTRFCVTRGWRIKVQYTPETVITTTVGVADPVAKKFLGQCRRWVRTTWRSNACSLFTDGSVWSQQPWCVYAVYLTSFTNFALFTDSALVYLLSKSCFSGCIWYLVAWILFTKATKVSAYFWEYPQDLWTFPFYVAFAYFHSLLKFWALLTFWDCAWSGRDFSKIEASVAGTSSDASSQGSAGGSTTAASLAAINAAITSLGEAQSAYTSSYQDPLQESINSLRAQLDPLLANQARIVQRDMEAKAQLERMVREVDKLGNTRVGQVSPALRQLQARLARLPDDLISRSRIPRPAPPQN